MITSVKVDIVIIGAGIAGLWLHHYLNNMGWYAVLLDKTAIGCRQTLSSQGIIHGGTKYTLNGLFSNAASAIAAMPNRWQYCLDGKGDIDLTSTKVLSQHQLMWSTQGFSSKLLSFFSSKALKGKVTAIEPEHYPPCFQHNDFSGHLYQLNEPVLDVPSLIENLAQKWRHRIFKTPNTITINNQANKGKLLFNNTEIHYRDCILTAGEGNQDLLQQLGIHSPKMQRRPLQMVLAKGKKLPLLYAHCIGASTKPLATITTHQHSDGEWVWYIGGNIAEEGVQSSSKDLINTARAALNKFIPWVSLDNVQWATHSVNRAEPAQSTLLKPDTAFVESVNNIHIAWPTKLALTPDLSDRVLEIIKRRLPVSHVEDVATNDRQLELLPPCPLSLSLWERSFYANH